LHHSGYKCQEYGPGGGASFGFVDCLEHIAKEMAVALGKKPKPIGIRGRLFQPGERIIDAQYASSALYVGNTGNDGGRTLFGVNFDDGHSPKFSGLEVW